MKHLCTAVLFVVGVINRMWTAFLLIQENALALSRSHGATGLKGRSERIVGLLDSQWLAASVILVSGWGGGLRRRKLVISLK